MPADVVIVEQGGRGGVADYTGQLARALRDQGVAVELATATDHHYRALEGVRVRAVFPYLRAGSAWRVLVRRLRLHKVYNGLGYLLAMVRVLPAARQARVVHVQGLDIPPLALLGFVALRLAGARIVHTPHNTFERGSVGFARSRRLLGRLSAHVIVHADADREAMDPALRAKAVVIPHGTYEALAHGGRPGIVRLRAPSSALTMARSCCCASGSCGPTRASTTSWRPPPRYRRSTS